MTISLYTGRDEEEAKDTVNAFKLRAFDNAVKAIDNLSFQIDTGSVNSLKQVRPLDNPSPS